MSISRSVPINKWVHLAFTYDLDTRNGTLYFNGTLEKYEVKAVSSPNRELQISNPMKVLLGVKADWTNYIRYFHGYIRDVNWIHGVLTPDGIRRLKGTLLNHF